MIHALTVFVSAFLLFLVQPLIAKQILPWFGGSASVWTVCLVFFQLVLLAGYAYADRLSRLLLRNQAIAHTLLLVLACAALPVIPDIAWKPIDGADPTLRIMLLLVATIGLPYMAVCTTGPLLQSWFSRLRTGGNRQTNVYRLFALSNLASLTSLVLYPFAIEPFATVQVQAWAWSLGFALFAVLAITAAWHTVAKAVPGPAENRGESEVKTATETHPQVPPSWSDHLLWLTFSGLGTVALLSVTTHITQDVAAVPFMWIVPLALYLLSFVLCFDSAFWYRRWLFMPAMAIFAPAMSWGLFNSTQGPLDIAWAVALFCIGLFVFCMFLHGELAAAKPSPQFLTRFYLMISTGGALGGLFVGLVAPHVFNGYWELPGLLIAGGLLVWQRARKDIPIGLIVFAALLLSALAWFCYQFLSLLQVAGLLAALAIGLSLLVGWRRRSLLAGMGLLGILATLGSGYFVYSYLQIDRRSVLVSDRNFFGTLRVKEINEEQDQSKHRLLFHGIIVHGEQSTDASKRLTPTSYYGRSSGVGLAIAQLRTQQAQLRIGVIGLGVGTLAAYGQAGDVFRYYEINPQVVDFAKQHFSYLNDSSATTEIVLGDARLMMEAEQAQSGSQGLDLLVVDAFSGDSIPVHLITVEALQAYRKHIKPGGVIAFHVSNRYLRLEPVVALLAKQLGMASIMVFDQHSTNAERLRTSRYVLVSDNQALLNAPTIAAKAEPVPVIPGLRVWTDDYNNLFQILK